MGSYDGEQGAARPPNVTSPLRGHPDRQLRMRTPRLFEWWLAQKSAPLRGSASNVLRPRAGRMRVHPASPAATGGRVRATTSNRRKSCEEDCPWLARQRPTLPCLETQYHRRCEV